jgi:hypothetical protein
MCYKKNKYFINYYRMLITDFKVVYICPDHNEKYHNRKIHMDQLLKDIGFTNFEHYKSSSENYPDCLMYANIDILKNNMDNPVIILEDDVDWNGLKDINYNPIYDAIYLGLSKCAGHPDKNQDLGEFQYIEWSDKQIKIINMLSLHAKLYISRKYKEAVIDIFEKYKNQRYHIDILISRIQKDYLVIGEKAPIFFQSNKFNEYNIEDITNFKI